MDDEATLRDDACKMIGLRILMMREKGFERALNSYYRSLGSTTAILICENMGLPFSNEAQRDSHCNESLYLT